MPHQIYYLNTTRFYFFLPHQRNHRQHDTYRHPNDPDHQADHPALRHCFQHLANDVFRVVYFLWRPETWKSPRWSKSSRPCAKNSLPKLPACAIILLIDHAVCQRSLDLVTGAKYAFHTDGFDCRASQFS